MTINSIMTSPIATHPLLTASTAGYPLIKAAEIMAEATTGNYQIFPQLPRYRVFAVDNYSFMPGASICEKLCC